MIKKCDQRPSAAPGSREADPVAGSAFSLGPGQAANDPDALSDALSANSAPPTVSRHEQSLRGIALFQTALEKGNMTAAASALKHLSDLHGLGRAGGGAEGAGAVGNAPDAALTALSDGELDALIQRLSA